MDWVWLVVWSVVLLFLVFGLWAFYTDPNAQAAYREKQEGKKAAKEAAKVATTNTTRQRTSAFAQEVVEYKSRTAFQQDSAAWLQQGWRIANVSDAPQRPGVARVATLGLGAMVVKPEAHVIVVYERAG